MKNIKRVLLFIFVITIFTAKANAAVNEDAACFGVTENSIPNWNAGFEVKMPVCKFERVKGEYTLSDIVGALGRNAKSPKEAYDAGATESDVTYWTQSADAKSYVKVNGTVALCAKSDRRVVAKAAAGICKLSINSDSWGWHRERININSRPACTGSGYTWNESYSNGNKCGRWYQACSTSGYVRYGTTAYCCPTSDFKVENGKCVLENSADTYYYPEGKTSETSNTESTGAKEIIKQQFGDYSDYDGYKVKCESKFKYDLECPKYKCTEEIKQYKACVPTFSIGNAKAYCINPSQGFNGSYRKSTFDFKNCKNSWENADCGYANILIEGAWQSIQYNTNNNKDYLNISDKAIYLALRLWAYHNKQPGFDDSGKTGIANVVGDSCENPISFATNKNTGKTKNVYKETYNYMYEAYFNKIEGSATHRKNITNLTSVSIKIFDKTSCDILSDKQIAISCNGVTKYAYALFFNTIFGNENMVKHLNELRGDGDGFITPTKVVPKDKHTEENGEEWSEWMTLKYEEKDLEPIFGERQEIDCDKVCDKKDSEYDAVLCEKAKPVCKTKLIVTNKAGEVNEYGNPICIKDDGCHFPVKRYAFCQSVDNTKLIIKVEARYITSEKELTVEKLIPCGDVKNNQYMFSFFYNNDGGTKDETRTTKNLINTRDWTCDPDTPLCNPKSYVDGKGGIKCEKNDNNYGKFYESYLRDPSLSCVVNMSQADQDKYDYSSVFGVKTSLCRVYCSDQINYYIADKEESDSGRHFIYNILPELKDNKPFGRNDLSTYKLTAAVKQTRNCVSNIYQDLPTNVDYKTLYGLETEPKTMTELYSNIIDKVLARRNSENSELLNSFLYDLYNCSLLTQSQIEAKGVHKPYTGAYDNVYEKVMNTFNSSNTQFFEDSNRFSDNVKYGMGPIVTNFTPKTESSPSHETPTGNLLFKSGNNISKSSISYGGVSSIKYRNAAIKYEGDILSKEYNYNELFTDSLSYYNGFNGSKASYNGKFPNPRYVYFNVSTNIAFYNSEIYQTVNDTGNIVVTPPKYDDLITLNSYIYPVNRNAFDMTTGSNSPCKKVDEKSSICQVDQKVIASPFKRRDNNDDFSRALLDGQTFSCFVKVYPYVTTGSAKTLLRVRNVDASNLFPQGYNGLEPADTNNWLTRESLIDEVQGIAREVQHGNLSYNDILEYRITLNPEQIRNIQEYNKTYSPYESQLTDNCTKVDEKYYENCEISFLRDLKAKNAQGDYSLGTLDPEYNDGISRYNGG